jgi:tRNA dimethylallyltransferase
MQIYRGMDIGTAKPTQAEMDGVPHHLLDVADPGEDFSVGRYVALATEAITDIHSRGKTAIVAGGTGLYLDSLVKGEEFAPPSREGERKFLEDAAEQKGIEYVYDMLMEADPETAERLHLSDRKRIIRAMEVFLITGLPLSWHIAQSRQRPPRYRPAWLGLNFRDRAKLYARIDARVDQMLAQGLEQEVQRLLEAGVDPQTTAMQAIGYKELASALRGECTVEEAACRIKQASRNYAKRQLTWFRRNDKIRWIYPDETPDLLQRALKLLAREPD